MQTRVHHHGSTQGAGSPRPAVAHGAPAWQITGLPNIVTTTESARVLPLRALTHVAGILLLLTAAKCPGGRAAPDAKSMTGARGDSAQQVVYGARMLLAHQNVSKGLLTAANARLYAGGTRLELQGVTFTFHDSAGLKTGTLSGQSGTYAVKTGQLDVRGKASVVREDGRRLESEQIRYDLARSTLSADGAFVYSDGAGAPRVTGSTFESDARLRRAPRRPQTARPR